MPGGAARRGAVRCASPGSERHLYRALPYLRHGDFSHLLVTEVQWPTVPTLRELLMAAAVAGIRMWLLVGDPVPDEGDTTVAELWELRAAGCDTYTPAEDALVELPGRESGALAAA
jgi:hypothetical protein